MRSSWAVVGKSLSVASVALVLAACGPAGSSSSPAKAEVAEDALQPAYAPEIVRTLSQTMKESMIPGLVILILSGLALMKSAG